MELIKVNDNIVKVKGKPIEFNKQAIKHHKPKRKNSKVYVPMELKEFKKLYGKVIGEHGISPDELHEALIK